MASAAFGLAIGGCSHTSERTWREISLSGDGEIVTLTALGPDALIGRYSPTAPVRPSLTLLAPDGSQRAITIHQSGGYAGEARWVSVATAGAAIVAIGGQRGGAHANTRYTVWRGDADAVTDEPQSFYTFGGPDAGELTGAAMVAGKPVVLGSWRSDRTGLDVAAWYPTGKTWNRTPSTGTPLGSTPTELLQAVGVGTTADAVVLSGSTTLLRKDQDIAVLPSVWTAGAGGSFTRTDLTATDNISSADAVGCDADRCLVLVHDGDRLQPWTIRPGIKGLSPTKTTAITTLKTTRDDELVAPVVAGGTSYVVGPGRDGSVLVSAPVAKPTNDWATEAGPSGTPVAMAVVGSTLLVATKDGSRTRLWQTALTN